MILLCHEIAFEFNHPEIDRGERNLRGVEKMFRKQLSSSNNGSRFQNSCTRLQGQISDRRVAISHIIAIILLRNRSLACANWVPSYREPLLSRHARVFNVKRLEY